MKTIEEGARKCLGLDSSDPNYEHTDDDVRDLNIFSYGAEFAQRWIPVEEELPPIDVKVLVKCSTGNWTTSTLRLYANLNTSWSGSSTFGNSITHWRPIELK